MTRWKDLWGKPAIRGAIVGLIMVPLSVVVLILASLRLGLVGPVAYCLMSPGTGLATLLKSSPPWDTLLVFVGNAGLLSASFVAFASRGSLRWYARVTAIVVYGTLSWFSFVAFGKGL